MKPTIPRAIRRHFRRLRKLGNSPHFIYATGILIHVWISLQWQSFQNDPDPIESSVVIHRWADRELYLSEELDGSHPITLWLLGTESFENTKKEVVALFDDYRNRALLDEDAQCAEALLHYALGDSEKAKSSLPKQDNSDYTTLCAAIIHNRDIAELLDNNAAEFKNRELSWWEVKAFQKTYQHRAPPELITESLNSTRRQKEIADFNTKSYIPYWLGILIGLPFIVSFLKKDSILPKQAKTFTRYSWPIVIVIAIYVTGDVVNIPLSGYISLLVESAFGETAGLIAFDLIFRSLDSILLLVILVPGFIFFKKIFGLFRPVSWKLILAALSLDLIISELIGEIALLLGPVDFPSYLSTTEDGWKGLAIALFSGVLLAPIAEEIVYRGFLFRSLRNWASFFPAAIIAGLFFTIVHFYDLSGSAIMLSFSLIAAWLYQRTGNLLNCIIFHALSNLIIITPNWLLYNYGY